MDLGEEEEGIRLSVEPDECLDYAVVPRFDSDKRNQVCYTMHSGSSSGKLKTTQCEGKSKTNSEVDGSEKVKTKLMSMWNNMKYGWTVKVKTNFSYESPIWLLGRCYHKKLQDPDKSEETSDFATRNLSMELFKQDFSSRIWFTYRREFPSLAGSNLTTDCGWGCMLRSGQMLLAQALVCHFLGRDWKWTGFQTRNEIYHRKIIEWFGDHPCTGSPFSLHHLVALGENSGKKAGEWYGPASVAYILRQALENAAKDIPLLDSICIYVAQDCTIYQQDVYELCSLVPRRHCLFSDSSCSDSISTSSNDCFYSVKDTYLSEKNIHSKTAQHYSPIKLDLTQSSNKTNCHNVPECAKPSKNYLDGNLKPCEMQEFHRDIQVREDASDSYNYDNSSVEEATEYFDILADKNIHKPPVIENSSCQVSKEIVDGRIETSVFYTENDSYDHRRTNRRKLSKRNPLTRSTSVPIPSTKEEEFFSVSECSDSKLQIEKDLLIESPTIHEFCPRWRGVVILVPVRLGSDTLNRAYIPYIRELLALEYCIGIIGGRPKHSLYFVGWQEDKLIYLDPHYCQETIDTCTSDFPLQSFHCTVPRKMTCTKMDPSCTVGFYCKSKKDFLNFLETIKQTLYKEKSDYPIFTIQEGKCLDVTNAVEIIAKEQQMAQSLQYTWRLEDDAETIEIGGDDFVVI